MNLSLRQINSLIEAQYHYFESDKPEKAEVVVERLMEPLYTVGRYAELLDILERAIEKVDEPDPAFYIYHARTLMALGRPDEALAALNLLKFEVSDDPELQAAILIDKGSSFRRLGDSSKAGQIIRDYQQAYEIYDEKLIPVAESEEYKDPFRENQATCLYGEGTIYQYFLENPDAAMVKYNQALEIYQNVKSADGIGVVTKQRGEIHGMKQFQKFYDPARAIEYLQAALLIFQENDYQNRVLETRYQLGRLQRSDPEVSLKLFQEYFRIASKLGLLREEAVAKRHIAELEFVLYRRRVAPQGPPSPASDGWQDIQRNTRMLGEAARVLGLFKFDIWSRRVLVNCYYVLGEIWKWLRDDEEALENFGASLQVCNEAVFRNRLNGDVRRRVRVLLKIVQILFQNDRDAEVEKLVAEYEKDFRQLELAHPTREQVDKLITSLTTEG